MKITPKTWLALTTGERLAIISNAVNANKQRWERG